MNKSEGGSPVGGEAERSKERRDYELACKYLEIARKVAASAVDFLVELHTKKDLDMNDLTRVQSGIESEIFYPLCDLSSLGQSIQLQAKNVSMRAAIAREKQDNGRNAREERDGGRMGTARKTGI